MPEDHPAPPRVPDYELLRAIGRGSYGVVWLARSVTGLYRAVKIVWRASFEDPQPYEREFRGIKEFAAISLVAPRQLALLHVGRNDAEGFFYYVMELADDVETGREINPVGYVPNTLKEVRARRQRLPAAEAVTLAVELAEGLAELHQRGLVHRDIKPSNIILVGGAPKLADIGLVASTLNSDQTMSRVGNPGYMPPDFPGVPSADVFGLGRVLYELAMGRERDDFPALPDLAALTDRKEWLELNEVLLRACAPDPAKRYPHASALLDDLRLLQAGKSVRRLRAAERHLGRALKAATVSAAIAAVAAGGMWLEHRRRSEAEAERDALAQRTIYVATLAQAQRALEQEDFGRARRILERAHPKEGQRDPRGFEWHALLHEASGDPSEVLRHNGPIIDRIRFSGDGKLIALQGADGVVRIVSSDNWKELKQVKGVRLLVGFSPDSQWIIGAGANTTLQRWSVDSGAPDSRTLPGNNRPLGLLGLRNQVISFASGSAGKPHAIHIWDYDRHATAKRIELEPNLNSTRWDFYRGAVSKDGKWCALSLITGRVQEARWKLEIYNLETGQKQFADESPHRLTALGFSADNTHLAVAFGDTAEIGLLNIANKQWVWRVQAGSNQTDVIAFSEDNRLLCAGGRDPVIAVFDPQTGHTLNVLRGHESSLTELAWTPRDNHLISAGGGGDVRSWQDCLARTPSEVTGLWRPAGGGRVLCLSRDGSLLSASDAPEKGAVVVSTDTLSEQGRIRGSWFPAMLENTFVSGLRSDGYWESWQLGRDRPDRNELAGASSGFLSNSVIALSSSHRVLGVCGARGELLFWDMFERRRLASTTAHNGAIWGLSISPDGKQAVTVGGDQQVVIWDTDGAKKIAQWQTPALCALFSRNGKTIFLGLSDGRIAVYSLPHHHIIRVLQTDSARVQTLAISANGNRLVAGGARGAVHLFSTEDWTELVTLRVPPRGGSYSDMTISNLSFADNDSVLAAYLNDGRIRLWRNKAQ